MSAKKESHKKGHPSALPLLPAYAMASEPIARLPSPSIQASDIGWKITGLERKAASALRPLLMGLVMALASNFPLGFSITFMNPSYESFKEFVNGSAMARGSPPLSTQKFNTIWNIFLNAYIIGFSSGMWTNPFFNDKVGRKAGFLWMNCVGILGATIRLVAILVNIYELLILGQFLIGVSISVTYQSLILMLQECAPTSIRGRLSYMSELCVAIFCLVGSIAAMDIVLGRNLVALLGFGIVPSVLAALAVWPLHESPKFLFLIRRDKAAALKAIRFYHGRGADALGVLEELQKEIISATQPSSFMELFTTPHLRKALMLAILALQNTTALWAFFFLSTHFLEALHINIRTAEWCTTAMLLFYAVGVLLGSTVIDKWGRRTVLLPLAAASWALLALYVLFAITYPALSGLRFACVGVLWAYVFANGFGVTPICWFLVAELVPQQHRSRATVLCYFANMCISTLTLSFIAQLFDAMGPVVFLIVYVAPGCLTLIVLHSLLPETKNREIHEIVAALKGNKEVHEPPEF